MSVISPILPGPDERAQVAPPAASRHHRGARRRFVRSASAWVALGYLGLLVALSALGPLVVSAEPNTQDLSRAFLSPLSAGHLLGTDEFGRDTLSRLVAAIRVDLGAVAIAVFIAVAIGVTLGLLAGYLSGWTDLVLLRITDALQSFPPLILAIALVGVLGQGLRAAMVAVGIIFAPSLLRVTRVAVLEVKAETFIEASASIGTPAWRILRTRILPNVLPTVMVQVSLSAGFALLAEAGLSFLGLGEPLPNASWGAMLDDGYQNLVRQPWMAVLPGVAIALTVLAFNQLGDAFAASFGQQDLRA